MQWLTKDDWFSQSPNTMSFLVLCLLVPHRALPWTYSGAYSTLQTPCWFLHVFGVRRGRRPFTNSICNTKTVLWQSAWKYPSTSQEQYNVWWRFLVHLCKMIISPYFFFHVFKILIFRAFREVKGQKKVQNNIKFCSSCSISQESYIIWLSFMLHMCKMISPVVFFNFKILIFQVIRGLKGQKMVQNDKNLCLSHLIFQEPYIIWSSFMVHIYV